MERINWEPVQYGPAETLDLGIIKIVVNVKMAPRGQPEQYYFSFGNLKSRREYDSREEARAMAVKTAREALKQALIKLDDFEPEE